MPSVLAIMLGINVQQLVFAALIFSSLFAVSEWRTHNVDWILLYCDSLFSNVIHDRYHGNQFFMASDLPRFANYMGLSLRMQYQLDNPTCGSPIWFYCVQFPLLTLDDITVALIIIQHKEHTLYLVHIPGMLQGIQHQKEQLYCLPSI